MFREKFLISSKINQWFPGHMVKGMNKMNKYLSRVDCILEVHDCRIPISGRNTEFMRSITCVKPHILIMNKSDTIDEHFKSDINRVLSNTCDRIIYTDCNRDSNENIKNIVPTILDVLKYRPRYNRENNDDLAVMIVGIPNVGKSTVINKLRQVNLNKRGKPMSVGPIAGVTRAVSEKLKISMDPSIYLYDTPGILTPVMSGPESALRLALCGTFSDRVIGEELMADYLLFWLNKRRIFHYVNFFDLDGPCDDINKVLIQIAIKKKLIINIKSIKDKQLRPRPDMLKAAQFMINEFRKNNLGKLLLDDDVLYKPKMISNYVK